MTNALRPSSPCCCHHAGCRARAPSWHSPARGSSSWCPEPRPLPAPSSRGAPVRRLHGDGLPGDWWTAAEVAGAARAWKSPLHSLTGQSLHRAINRALKALAANCEIEVKVEVVRGFKVLSARIPVQGDVDS
jgi:hypothetical protein